MLKVEVVMEIQVQKELVVLLGMGEPPIQEL
jgi:hypothetical protein